MEMKNASFTAAYVDKLARQHGVKPARGPLDEAAATITRLSGDEVASDHTEDLIVALKREGIIDGARMVSLLGAHLDETYPL